MENRILADVIVGQLNTLAEMTSQMAKNIMQASQEEVTTEKPNSSGNDGTFVYGMKGIADLFGVSLVTAHAYKRTWLKPAISQRGRKIITDKELALRLFAQHNKK